MISGLEILKPLDLLTHHGFVHLPDNMFYLMGGIDCIYYRVLYWCGNVQTHRLRNAGYYWQKPQKDKCAHYR